MKEVIVCRSRYTNITFITNKARVLMCNTRYASYPKVILHRHQESGPKLYKQPEYPKLPKLNEVSDKECTTRHSTYIKRRLVIVGIVATTQRRLCRKYCNPQEEYNVSNKL